MHSSRQSTWALWTIRSLAQTLHYILQHDHSIMQIIGTMRFPRELKIALKKLVAHRLHLVATNNALLLHISDRKAIGLLCSMRAVGAIVANLATPAAPARDRSGGVGCQRGVEVVLRWWRHADAHPCLPPS